jgi:YegS/Rv2252/BmrU family lipid kinase
LRWPPSRPSRSINATKTVFLVNPASENGATGRRWPELARAASAAGLTGDALVSERPGQLGDLARRAVAEGATLLVAVGGDGTVNEIVNGVGERDGFELAVLPRGTGWDFVRTYGIPHRFEDAVAVARDGVGRGIDLGEVAYRAWSGETASRRFANVASAGMSGAIAQRANRTTKALGGKISYAFATFAVFARWRNTEVAVTVADRSRRGRMHDVIVANGRYFGGGMMICPQAEPDDGLFDVLLIGDLTKNDLLLTLPKTYRGRHLPHPKAELLRGATVAVDAAKPLPVELDGEQPGTTPARFDVLRNALRVRVPRR